ncbi:helix-turn-helix transcriptional regulator [Nonomuraea aurantiaca]|uniref:helix-turn-helix transcriptional regulator n=1 Tax=Nonomuraea aurantiaca TaxID=2878562 RepID=UPI001CD99DFD|nr:LuxR family transcriptional regulator [Nonomuraea aurantiaca]MCA2224019.1 LuxR C-terminal-related transcriptional regulator [Nonomuraea aurantiaca]
MRGREQEWHDVDGLLDAVQAGKGATLLVDGEPGVGKTRLLDEAAATAGERGIAVLRGALEELGELVPCGILFEALDLRLDPDSRTLEALRTRFEEWPTAPVLAVLDDLQWADPATLVALRTLHGLLEFRPIGWLLSRSTGVEQDQSASLFDLLERHGAGRVRLSPLSPAAAVALATDMLGAAPGPAALALVDVVGGNPLLITELLAGLRDEGQVLDGDAALRIPDRFTRVVRHWIGGLSAVARNLVETAAVLGRSFAPEQAASLLGTTTAALLPAVEESMAAGILAATAHDFAFRHELVRLVIAERVPPPVRQALLGRLDLVATIDTAMVEGRLRAAEQLVRGGLAEPSSAHASTHSVAELHCVLADVMYLTGSFEEAMREAETVLALPDLPDHVRDRALLVRLYTMTRLRSDEASVRTYAHEVIEAGARHSAAATAAALIALAQAERDEGRLSHALALAADARRLFGANGSAVHPYESRLISATILTDVHRLDEARLLVQDAREDMFDSGHQAWEADLSALAARSELLEGRLDSAAGEAQRALSLAADRATPLSAAAATNVLATVALRRGNVRAAVRHAADLPGDSLEHALIVAQVTEACDGPLKAMTLLADLLERQRSMLAGNPTASAWLVRVALAVDARAVAKAAVATAEELAAVNPGFPALTASAAHARGLLDGDREALSRAAERADDVWGRASATEDLGVLQAAGGRHDDAAVSLDRALAIYYEIGSVRDSARVRKRLRAIGVRHRHWSYADRPVSGWDSLTETEWNVSLLVADGWSNRKVAEQMFISAHTVAFHLRHVYSKLQIKSRVELTRLVIAQGRDDTDD